MLHSLPVFSHSLCHPQSNWALLVLLPRWVGLCVRLGVSPTAAPTSTGVFSQRFEAFFPFAGALGCVVCFIPPTFLLVYLCSNVGPQGPPATTLWGLPAAAWPALFHNPPPPWVRQLPPCRECSPPWLPVSAPPTSLNECFFFNSLVVRLQYSLISGSSGYFLFLNLLLSFFWLCQEPKRIYLCLHLGWK